MKVLLMVAGLLMVGCSMEEEQSSGMYSIDSNSGVTIPEGVTAEDVDHNSDGVIDIKDLVIASKFFGQDVRVSPKSSAGIDSTRYFDAENNSRYTYGLFKGRWKRHTKKYIDSYQNGECDPSLAGGGYDGYVFSKIATRFKLNSQDEVLEIKLKFPGEKGGLLTVKMLPVNYFVKRKVGSLGKIRYAGGTTYPSLSGVKNIGSHKLDITGANYLLSLFQSEKIYDLCIDDCRTESYIPLGFNNKGISWVNKYKPDICPARNDIYAMLPKTTEGYSAIPNFDDIFPLGTNRLAEFGSKRVSDSCKQPFTFSFSGSPRNEDLLSKIFGNYQDCPSGFGWYSEVSPEQVRAEYFPEDL